MWLGPLIFTILIGLSTWVETMKSPIGGIIIIGGGALAICLVWNLYLAVALLTGIR